MKYLVLTAVTLLALAAPAALAATELGQLTPVTSRELVNIPTGGSVKNFQPSFRPIINF